MRSSLFIITILNLMIFGRELSAQIPTPSTGRIIRHAEFPSQFITPRNIDVWLPEGYDPAKKYAVLYMHDGQMLFDSTITWNKQEWRMDEVAGTLIKSETIEPCIIVGIWNHPTLRRAEYFPAKAVKYIDKAIVDSAGKNEWQNNMPLSDNYLSFIVRELKPFIDRTYSVYTDRSHTFIGGSSMGGLISLYAICEYPATFGGAICMSTHWPGSLLIEGEDIPQGLLTYFKKNLPNPAYHRIYFDLGTETIDKPYKPYQERMNQFMKKNGYKKGNWVTKIFNGDAHTEQAWARRLHVPLEFMLGH